MKVILMTDIKGLGMKGDVVNVSDGYARNYLLPRKYAQEATDAALKTVHTERQAKQDRQAREEQAAVQLAKKLEGLVITIAAKAGEGGKLYGSITSKDIASSLSRQRLNVDRRKIDLKEPLRALGTYQVPIKVYQDIVPSITVKIVDESAEGVR
ncbi:MAG: 50S ribosomal protein L9 [Bacillota bacterium]|jgi:large subunit ribosomal protein L9